MLAIFFLVAFKAGAQGTTAKTNSVDLGDIPLESLMNLDVPKVYAASKVEQKTTEAPASITVVTAEDMKMYGYQTLADVLESVQGFDVSYDYNYDFLGARGLNLGDFNSRILLLVDGHRVNNNLTDGAAIGTDFILDMDLVSQVEIIRGPGSVLYGNNAFFGVINVVTRQAKDINGIETSFSYGSFDTYKGRVTYGKQFTNGVSLLLSGSIYESQGEESLYYGQFNTPAQNNGVAQKMDGDSYYSFLGTLGYNDFTLEGAYNHREKVNPTAQYDLTTFDDSRLRTRDDRGYVELKYAHSFNDVVDVTARVYADSYDHYIGYPQSLLSGTNVLFSDFTTETDKGEWWGTELELNKTLFDRHTITLGGEYRDDFLQEQEVSGQTAVNRERQSYGVYLQGDFTILTNLHLIPGVRYDKYTGFGASVDPRVALIYNPFKGSTLKAIYGTAFRDPNFEELSNPAFQNLSPEEMHSYEVAYEQEIEQHLRSSVSVFYNQMNNLIFFDSGNYTNFNANTKGVELALEGSWADGIRGRASYSFQYSHENLAGLDLPDSPNHLFKLSLSAPVYKDKLFAGLEFLYTSDRLSFHNTTDSSGEPLTVQGQEAGGYGLLNLTLYSRNVVKNLSASASVYNVLNCKYFDPASQSHVQDTLQQPGRSFLLKATYHF